MNIIIQYNNYLNMCNFTNYNFENNVNNNGNILKNSSILNVEYNSSENKISKHENTINIGNFLNNRCVNIYVHRGTDYITSFLVEEMQKLLI